MATIINTDFISVFKNGLKNNIRTISISTLLSERNLRRIDYKPYYQRNYVWDIEKQSFFIESVLLGTEIPPIILFKSGTKIEIIDGRQRFETLKRFKEDEFALHSKGLMELPALDKLSFNKLDDTLKDIFLNSNIRIFEFEVINEVTNEIEDKVKKEIFRRYNSGITPLTNVEVDAAKYDKDPLSRKIEDVLKEDSLFYNRLNECFFYNEKNNLDLIDKMVDFLRESYVLPYFPISRYARGKNRNGIIEILYNSLTPNDEDLEKEYCDYKNLVDITLGIYNQLSSEDGLKRNKLFYQTLLWGVCIMKQEEISIEYDCISPSLISDFIEVIHLYSDEDSFHYKSIMARYTKMAEILSRYFSCDFSSRLKSIDFNTTLKQKQQGSEDVADVMHQLEGLRINKPSPISKPVEEILHDVQSNKYLIRPSYQRQEKISENKASSIIESILLGIPLPPIFIYKRKDGIKEVIDGQQRLLSIIAFTGNQYMDEDGALKYAKINNFKLKKTNILSHKGKNYHALSESSQDLIQDFNIDEIVIEQSLNPNFEPTDLFIRLNQKPYPIQFNSFEMWNSTVYKEVIQSIKDITLKYMDWFFIKENKDIDQHNRTDRMENEELITLLAYINYSIDNDGSFDKVIGTFKRSDRITCRIKDKGQISDFLNRLDEQKLERDNFLFCIKQMENRIDLFRSLFDEVDKASLNEFFNVKKNVTFRRSAQDFYIVWIILHYANDINKIDKIEIKNSIIEVLRLLKNTNGQEVDKAYYDNFITKLNQIVEAKKQESTSVI